MSIPTSQLLVHSTAQSALQALVESNELPQKPEPVKEEEEAKEEE